MPKKILIFFPHRLKERSGGAYTYLWHLKNALPANGGLSVHFLDDIISFEPVSKAIKRNWINSLAGKLVPSRLKRNRRIRKYLDQQDEAQLPFNKALLNFNDYDLLHFHEAIDIWRNQDLLDDYRGVVVFTPHSPKPYHLEVLEDVFYYSRDQINASIYTRLEEIDKFAFSRANQLIVPCEEALDDYYQWKPFATLVSGKPIHYVLTGCPPALAAMPPSQLLERFGIPADSFVVSFTGRHNATKGYDLVINAAKALLDKYPAMYFLVAGKTSTAEQFNHPRFIRCGWTDDPHSVVNASQIHLAPGKVVYFDLNTIEVMSLGKPIILSARGGNRYLQRKIFSKGLIFINTSQAHELIVAIEKSWLSKSQLDEMGKENILAYESNFTSQRFAAEYMGAYKNILSA